jgi:hypothetical protein
MLADSERRRVWGEHGRRRAHEKFGAERFRADVRDLYAVAIAGSST